MIVRLASLAAGGDAVGRTDDGRVVFADGGAPGDLVELEITETKSRFLRGRVRRVVEAGPSRVVPPCALAETCGGCPWQIIDDATQRASKEAIVARAFHKLPVAPGTKIDPLIAAPRTLGYRSRATMHADRGVVGFHARRSHALVAVEHCPALVPGLDRALQRARALPLGDDATLRGTIVEETGEVHLAIEPGRNAGTTLAQAAAALVGREHIVGILVGERVFGAATIDAGGIAVTAAGFRQANEAQNDRLRAHVRALLDAKDRRVLELHAGDGNFTRDLDRAARVLAVEESADAIARLRRSLPRVEAVAGRAADVVRRRGGEGWERALLDPPRAGDRDAVRALAQHRVPHIVYVSCDPATLARDAQVLTDNGYTLSRVTPFDLMPHTDHVEVVLLAVSNGARSG